MGYEPGQELGNYRILQRIGGGGMGSVYLAEHPIIGKRVALKVIHKDLAANREVIARFVNEAKAVNKIGNEHVVQIYDFGLAEDGEYFLVMEYLPGHTLAQEIVEKGHLEVPRAIEITKQIASGLGAAHSCGIVHRDLKPDNIMLQQSGQAVEVKVLDFGLAKMLRDHAGPALTARGVLLGTPHFMSPEACAGSSLDTRADVYSTGILLFQMLSGTVPFDAPTSGAILLKHMKEQAPPLRGINPEVPPAVEQVVLRCLEKEPSRRFQTMDELSSALFDPGLYLRTAPVVSAAPSADHLALRRPAERSKAAITAQMFAKSKYDTVPDGLETVDETTAHQKVQRELAAQNRTVADSQFVFPAPRRNLVWLPGVALVVGAVVLLGLALAGDEGDVSEDAGSLAIIVKDAAHAGAPLTVADAASALPGPRASETVTLEVDTIPRGAEIFLDGQKIGDSPLVVKLDASSEASTVVAKLHGYPAISKVLVPILDRQLKFLFVAPPARETPAKGSSVKNPFADAPARRSPRRPTRRKGKGREPRKGTARIGPGMGCSDRACEFAGCVSPDLWSMLSA